MTQDEMLNVINELYATSGAGISIVPKSFSMTT